MVALYQGLLWEQEIRHQSKKASALASECSGTSRGEENQRRAGFGQRWVASGTSKQSELNRSEVWVRLADTTNINLKKKKIEKAWKAESHVVEETVSH